VTPTAPPPTPLLVYLDSLPPSQVTPTPPSSTVIPRALVGKILFWSDREGASRLFALDPTNNRIAYLTQEWPYFLAKNNETQSSDRRYAVLVQDRVDTKSRTPGVFVQDRLYKQTNLLAAVDGWSYDPVFSPRDNRIAFVSVQAGNDEVYSINPDGSDMRRLTSNSWEWDKHPSWSPDGSQIVFWSNRDSGRRQLWVMNADGSNQHRLFSSAFNDWDPVWVK
jgi:Tol biopolymer transport system component